jgi:hypothetical protein
VSACIACPIQLCTEGSTSSRSISPAA